jgi:hypothetical protein
VRWGSVLAAPDASNVPLKMRPPLIVVWARNANETANNILIFFITYQLRCPPAESMPSLQILMNTSIPRVPHRKLEIRPDNRIVLNLKAKKIADLCERLAKFPAEFIWSLPEWVLQAGLWRRELSERFIGLANLCEFHFFQIHFAMQSLRSLTV